jgi:hypothetical protein
MYPFSGYSHMQCRWVSAAFRKFEIFSFLSRATIHVFISSPTQNAIQKIISHISAHIHPFDELMAGA